ncbi:MAG: HPr family phosphocarrier protein [Hyphomicrobiaceae bacterium]|nr:HPr family phosphocarrier protein [Hyphomicrobiaceae bacterium]
MNIPQDTHSRQVLICNTKGLHARASALFVKCAQSFDATISVARDDETVSGNSIMELLMLAAAKGTFITITTSGAQSSEALEQLSKLVEAGFYEEE